MELCNKIGQSSVVKIIFKKQLFFKVKLGLKHDNILPKIAKKKIWLPVRDFFSPPTSTYEHRCGVSTGKSLCLVIQHDARMC